MFSTVVVFSAQDSKLYRCRLRIGAQREWRVVHIAILLARRTLTKDSIFLKVERELKRKQSPMTQTSVGTSKNVIWKNRTSVLFAAGRLTAFQLYVAWSHLKRWLNKVSLTCTSASFAALQHRQGKQPRISYIAVGLIMTQYIWGATEALCKSSMQRTVGHRALIVM